MSEKLAAMKEQRADLAARQAKAKRREAEAKTKQQADLQTALGDFDLESQIIAARGTGDQLGASHLERQMNIRRMTRDFESQGMDSTEARRLAANRANMEWTLSQKQGLRETTVASSARSVGLGGTAFSNREDVQRKMASLQEQANRYLSEQAALLKRIEAKLQTAEVFD